MYLFLFFYSCDGIRLSPLIGMPKMGPLYQPRVMAERMEHWENDNLQGKTEILGEEPGSVPFCPPKIPR
jgi:hypothetical protein